MNEKIQNAFKATKSYLSNHSPEILIGLGIASMTTSTILAVKATPKALKLLEYEKNLHISGSCNRYVACCHKCSGTDKVRIEGRS